MVDDPSQEASRAYNEESLKDMKLFRELVGEKLDYKQAAQNFFVPLYAKHFSEQELADLIAFFKTPAGQRYVATMAEYQNYEAILDGSRLDHQLDEIMREVYAARAKRLWWEKTMSDMRILAAALEAWATDHDEKYPQSGTWEELRKDLEGNYVKELPEKDSWGTRFLYVVTADREGYRIVSADADSVSTGKAATSAEPRSRC